ncbi:MAG: oatA 2 [Phycisphaerales bacterium]|nr:oatA 2 [Phycisphaerales bacterium]
MATPIQTAVGYRPEIDGLRALAVSIVVLFHAGLGFPGGYVGVDVFFVISGFLITSLILKDLAARQFSIVGFYELRCRRIIPASVFVSLVVLAVATYVMLPLDLEWLGRSAIAHAACLANVFFYQQSTQYFGGEASTFPLLHMWSLAVEEQFYVLFPVLLIVCAKVARTRQRPAIVVMTAGLATVSFAASIWYTKSAPTAAFFLLPSRAWELLLGALLAMGPRPAASRAVREICSWMAVLAVALPAVLYGPKTAFPGLAALPPCLGAAMFIWSCRGRPVQSADDTAIFQQTWIGRVFSLPPFVFIGAISYSLYLWHWPALVLAKYWHVVPLPMAARLLMVALTVGLSAASWRWIERPFRRRTLGRSRSAIFAFTVVALASVAGLGSVFQAKAGLPKRFSTAVQDFDATRRELLIPSQLHNTNPQHDQLPMFGAGGKDAPIAALLWGDSHAAAALPAFDAIFKARGLSGRAAIRSSTAPLLDYVVSPTVGMGDRSPIYNKAVLDYIARHHIQTVYLTAFWTRDIENSPAKLIDAIGHTIDALRKLGVQIYILQQVPTYAFDIPVALSTESRRGQAIAGWRKTFDQHHAAQAVMYDLAARFTAPDCTFIDPATAFRQTDSKDLAVMDRGRSLYHDDNHLSRWGARRVLGPLLNKLIPQPAADSKAAPPTTAP